VDVSWKNLDDAIKLARKLGILYKIYHNEYLMQLAAPLQPEMKRIIINGTPAHMKLSLTTSLAHAQTLQDVVDFLKEVRNLETSKVVSPTASTEAPTKATKAPTKAPTEGKRWPLPQPVSFQASTQPKNH
jgi:hypothetical protein